MCGQQFAETMGIANGGDAFQLGALANAITAASVDIPTVLYFLDIIYCDFI